MLYLQKVIFVSSWYGIIIRRGQGKDEKRSSGEKLVRIASVVIIMIACWTFRTWLDGLVVVLTAAMARKWRERW